jgi:hypothetical protein
LSANEPSAGWQIAQADAGTNDYTTGGAVWTGTADAFFNNVDGTAASYASAGCQTILVQNLANVGSAATASETAVVIAADCVSAANAQTMFQSQQQLYSFESITLSGYDPSVAFAIGALGGSANAYAHFKQYYFEIDLTGYADQPTALNDLPNFLAYFSTKSQ